MLKFNQGIDIVKELGKVDSAEAAMDVLGKRLTPDQLERLQFIKNSSVLEKIANAIVMCDPDRVFVNTGSAQDQQVIRELALQKGEEQALPMPDHTIHYDLKEEQGRIIDRTYYIANDDELVSSLAKRMSRTEALETVRQGLAGLMKGMTMIIGFYSRGPVGAQVSNPAMEITSSSYVSHSAELLYRNIYADFEKEVNRAGHFYTNIHSEGLNRPEDLPEARVLMDRSHRTTYSYKCTYAGNTLLLKKGNHRFSVDRSVYEKRALELA
ncbi:MAG: phosphoenolpyruvate carboxykinase, partial [Desulfobacteraceae bacterium]